jgi:V8-like Glu-specific endopeptidase
VKHIPRYLSFLLILTLIPVFASAQETVKGEPQKIIDAKQAFIEKAPGNFNPLKYMQTQQQIYDWLMAESASLSMDSLISIYVTSEELAPLENGQCESCGDGSSSNLKQRIGLTKPVDINVSFAPLRLNSLTGRAKSFSHGKLQATPEGGLVWTAAAESAGATALRIHLTDFSLPTNAALYIYNTEGQAFGPYTGKGPNGDGDFWTNTVTGSIAYLQLRQYGPIEKEDLENVNFTISDIAHLGEKYLLPFLQKPHRQLSDGLSRLESICSVNAPCVIDASCYSGGTWSAINDAKNAVAHMQFVSGAYIYICSGGLVADTDPASQIPYFLTANHCISKPSEAGSLECYWQFWTSNCNGSCYDPVGAVPRTVGATLLKGSNRNSDYALLQLNQPPPAGSVFLGWLSTPVANTHNYELFRISHPGGAPQAFSRHTVNTNPPVVCKGWSIGKWIYSKDVLGATEGGSSGSPVCNSTGQIVGQLSGACGYNVNDTCDNVQNSTCDGAFANYFADIEQWLAPQNSGSSSEAHVQSISLNTTQKGKNTTLHVAVTVLDENGNPVANATVSGTFSGDIGGSTSAVTDTNGIATFKMTDKVTVSTFSFCVDNIIHDSLSYDSSANMETCKDY